MGARAEQQHGRERRASTFPLPCSWAALALGCAAVAFIAALLPVDIGYHLTSDANTSQPPHVIADIGASKAFAVADPVQGSMEFIEECARAAGVTANQFVCTVAGSITAVTGMVTGDAEEGGNGGVKLSNSLADNLSNLVDAADYPSWDTLDSSSQSAWGTKENYDSAKFVTLLYALGYEDMATDWWGSYTPSGGGTFEPDIEQQRKFQQIGRIADRWSMGLGNTFESLSLLVSDRGAVERYFGVSQPGYGFSGAGISGWPSDWPTYLEFGNGSVAYLKADTNFTTSFYFCAWASDSPVWVMMTYGENGSTYNNYRCWMFSESPFKFASTRSQPSENPERPTLTPTSQASHRVQNGADYYYAASSYDAGKNIVECTFPLNFQQSNNHTFQVLDIIMGRGGPNAEGGTTGPTLTDYPEVSPAPDEMIYYPSEGVTTNNTWNNYTTPTPIVRPDNPYNPGDQTGTDKWKDETTANMIPLQGIRFDKLFPFCLSYDVKNLFEKVEQVTLPESSGGVYNVVHIPFVREVLGPDSVFDLDLTPLHDLLLMVRPFVQILIAAGLIFSIVWFWRGILTG